MDPTSTESDEQLAHEVAAAPFQQALDRETPVLSHASISGVQTHDLALLPAPPLPPPPSLPPAVPAGDHVGGFRPALAHVVVGSVLLLAACGVLVVAGRWLRHGGEQLSSGGGQEGASCPPSPSSRRASRPERYVLLPPETPRSDDPSAV